MKRFHILFLMVFLPFIIHCEKLSAGKFGLYDWVDLGLPSGTLWASHNVDAEEPWEYGDYFWWGKMNPAISMETISNMKKLSAIEGHVPSDISGSEVYDKTRVKWGAPWRLPTKTEAEELVTKCLWEWTNMNGINGYKVTGPNGKSIFLPAAGSMLEYGVHFNEQDGVYLTSTLNPKNPQECFVLGFTGIYEDELDGYVSEGSQEVFPGERYIGHTIRPVATRPLGTEEPTVKKTEFKWIDLGLPSGNLWSDVNIGAPSPSDFGKYYTWGEKDTKIDYAPDNALTSGKEISSIQGELTYDVAKNENNAAVIPSFKDWQELKNFGKWQWTQETGKYGYRVTGETGNSIFLPAGWLKSNQPEREHTAGFYWTATPLATGADQAYAVKFGEGGVAIEPFLKGIGMNIRAIKPGDNQTETPAFLPYEADWVDLGLPSGTLWLRTNYGGSKEGEYGNYYQRSEALDLADSLSLKLPSREDIEELISNCKIQLKRINGFSGREFTGPNGNTLFIPFSGKEVNNEIQNAGDFAVLWLFDSNDVEYDGENAIYINWGDWEIKAMPPGDSFPLRWIKKP